MNSKNHFTASTQLKLSPFFKRTSQLNESQEWSRWSGYLSATNYELTHENEYFAIRTKAGLLDISPLKKYIIEGENAENLIDNIITRNIQICNIGQVMYTTWCDENGKVIDDGTIQRLEKNKFRITSANPNLLWFYNNSMGLNVSIKDDSSSTAALALQGPNSRLILNSISSVNINNLKYFWITETKFGGIPVSISRTGYTGDLGYEIWMNCDNALDIWDLLMERGRPYGITPVGLNALDICRIEAGLILLNVDYISSQHAIIESRKSSPYELGLGWTVKLKKNNFIGKTSLIKEKINGVEWKLVGIEIQWEEFEKLYKEVGIPPILPSKAWRRSTPLFNKNNEQIGYATSGTWSPILKKYIALAHIQSKYSSEGSELMFEVRVNHFRKLTKAIIVKTPFFNPKRKYSCPV
ncbi:MAG: hypothetical protein CMG75_05855 [Candidatus Marinimicrobia bacterium]|nr:hypothetical protein [Candidatus Neomarinimicrobiota bacterium]|tara:strand:- start:8278 stop:9510 length:1233 start_codon:yes stop_codon:yes gene_type:complete